MKISRIRAIHVLVILSLASLCFGFQSAPTGTDIAPIVGLIMARALQLTTIVKLAVDGLLKGLFGAEGNKLIVAACVLGVLVDFGIVAVSQGAAGFTVQNSVMALIAGVVAGIGSKAITSTHEAVRTATVNGN